MFRLALALGLLIAWGAQAQSTLDISQKDWTAMPDTLRGSFLTATQLESGLGLEADFLTIQETDLSWSPGTKLVRVMGGWEPSALVMYFLRRPEGALIHLDGSYESIVALNGLVAPKVTEDTVGDYLWFTGFFVRSERGPFLIVESVQDRFIPPLIEGKGDMANGYASVNDIPRQLNCLKSEEGFRCVGTVYHAQSIYDADFEVSLSGLIDMPSSRPLAAKLAYAVNAPIDPRKISGFYPFQ